jgi:hypothetical protein
VDLDLAFPLSLVGVTPGKKRCRSWFFALPRATPAEVDRFFTWVSQADGLKFCCFAVEYDAHAQPVFIGYLDFVRETSVKILTRTPGLEVAHWTLRNSWANGVTASMAANFVRGVYEDPVTHRRKTLNVTYQEWRA